MKTSTPHILLLMADQLRHDVVSPAVTPHLEDFLNRNGTLKFNNAYTSTPTCTPARAALLTGKSPWAHGMLGYGTFTDCNLYPTTLPRILQQRFHYRTIAVGKNHFGLDKKKQQGYQNVTLYDALPIEKDDYDDWFQEIMPESDPLATCGLHFNDWPACPYEYEEYVHPTTWTTRTALKTLQDYFGSNDPNENAPENPLLLKISYHRPHSPYDPPRRLLEKYTDGGPKAQIPQMNRHVNDSSWDRQFRDFPMSMSAWAGNPGLEAARHSRAGYLASVEFVDENLGEIFQYLEDHNLTDHFLIVWLSDHGDMNGDHYLWRKGYPWEGSAHIPMAMRLPGSTKNAAPSASSDAFVELRDVAPTIYDALGILEDMHDLDPLLDGRSLLPILQDPEHALTREWLDLEHDKVYVPCIHWNALVGQYAHPDFSCHRWKYVFHAYSGQEQLFCLDSPQETHDLALQPEFALALRTWRERLVHQFETENRGPNWVQHGELQIRVNGTVYGDHFPCPSKRKAGRVQTS
eukprot:Nitzschia sp. Nitz4//scaffold70_size99833//74639//76195//NITZ4_004606-RA/size99833-processed-gene-0.18-mRNA-1//1//CDS//3329557168//5328//frame0